MLAACGGAPPVDPGAPQEPDQALSALGGGGATVWARQLGGKGEDMGLNVAYDSSGNLLLSVMYTHGLDLGGGPLPTPDPDARCFALAKLRPDGTHLWSHGYCATQSNPGEADRYALPYALGVDRWGNVMIGGRHSGGLDLGAGPLPAGNFVAKLSASGAHLWSRQVLSDDAAFHFEAIEADSKGDFAALVRYRADAYDDSKPTQLFLIKYRGSDGWPAWGRIFDHPAGRSDGWSLAVDEADNLFIAGSFRGSVSFGGPTLTATYDSPFFVKLSSNGAHLLTRALPVDHHGLASGIAARGNRILVGGTASSFHFRGQAYDAGAYLMAFDAAGNEAWARSYTGAAPNLAAGWHNELVAYGDGAPWELGLSDPPVLGQPPPEPPGANFYVARFERSEGRLLWARGIRGDRYFFTTPPSAGNVAVDHAGGVTAIGSFAGTADFGRGAVSAPDDEADGFLLRLAP